MSKSPERTRGRRSGPSGGGPPPASTPASGVRLNKFLADMGVASRRKCDELIAAGKVSVDGLPVVELGTRVDPETQTVECDGVVFKPERATRRYYLLNKPRGVLCTNDVREARTRAIDLITDRKKGRIYTVGRLDEDSTGLILLTNDGDFAHRVAHPRHGVPKTYLVKVKGKVGPQALEKLRKGTWLSEGRTEGAHVRVRKRTSAFSVLSVTLREGKNREVRRIFAKVGHEVLTLRRTRIGDLSDPKLRFGEWRRLRAREVRELEALSEQAQAADFARGGAQGKGPGGRSRQGGPERGKTRSKAASRAASRPPSRRERGTRGQRGGR